MHHFLHSLFVATPALALTRAVPSVTIPAGTLHGTTCSNGASAFLSVPFAIPPVGNLRWTSPEAYNQTFPTSGYNASAKGAICIQFGGQELTIAGIESEDWYKPPVPLVNKAE
jgi:carboxylesterase type B